MAAQIIPVILAGGQGTRLWPLSRAARPKQFLPLLGPRSLFQETLARVADAGRYLPPLILTNAEYRFLVADQALEMGVVPTAVLLEPVARNTAPAIAAAAAYARDRFGPDVLLHVLPSDHAIFTDDGYWLAVDTAARAATRGRLVTFGLAPTSPETGYGYVEAGALQDGVAEVARFVEKPDRARAEALLAAGGHYWNSGMFMLGAGAFLDEGARLAPEVFQAATGAVTAAVRDLDFVRLDEAAFTVAPSISVDYAIFERTHLAGVIPVSFPWSDLGSWDAVWKASPQDGAGNVVRGPATLSNTTGSLVMSERAHVAVEGLSDIAVIASEDAVYVGRLSEAQLVGAMVKRLRADPASAPLTEIHPTAYRPWGGFSTILSGERFLVKRLFVNPGKRLSLQKHHHRSEHWVVVRGTAEVHIGDLHISISENESVYVPRGELHRLSNPGKIMLELIEVQTGSYLGDDDIVRIEDEYGRAGK